MTSSNNKIRVLFVCFGNTCRSPMAEAIFKDFAEKNCVGDKFHVDSAALSNWQVGCDVNTYTDQILKRIGITNFKHRGREISYKDFSEYDYILGMDLYHIRNLTEAAEALKSSAKILLLGHYNPNKDEIIISDPICGNLEVFEKCYEQISVSCEMFFMELIKEFLEN